MSIEHPLGFHVTMRLADDRVLAPSDVERRRAARSILRVGRDFDLLAFRLADTHLHALVHCTAEASGRFCQRVACSLLRRLDLPAPFERGRRRPILDQRHLYRAFFYVLNQDVRHGTLVDPFHDASSLPDTLGLRLFDLTLAARVRAYLPRVRAEEPSALLGGSRPEATSRPPSTRSGATGPAEPGESSRAATPAPPVHVVDAVLAAACATRADERDAVVRRAVTAALRLSANVEMLREAAGLLGPSARSSRRARRSAPDPTADRAILGQLSLRARFDLASAA
jgi:hypothetical protein